MRVQVLIPLIIGLSACGIGSALLYQHLKDRKKKTPEDEEDSSPLTSVAVITCAELAIHNEFVPIIVGKDSAALKSLQTKTRTKISFHAANRHDDDDHQTCRIEGTLEAIEDARKIIATIASRPVLVTDQLDVSQSACGKIIGRCGEMLQEICRKSNAKVSVNSSEGHHQRQVVITGTRMQVNAARALIDEKVQEDRDLRRAIEASELKRERRGPLKSSALGDSQSSLPDSVQSSSARASALLSTTGQMEVYVSAIASPSKFWLQMVGPQSTELDTLIEQMSDYYDHVDNQQMHLIEDPSTLDQIVAAQFKWDNKWYRARIVAILPNEFSEQQGMVLDIYFLDYGDSAYVAAHEVFQLRADFLTLRFQAVECFLANVAPLDTLVVDQGEEGEMMKQRFKWDRKAVERFEQLTHVAQWELLQCRVVCHEEKKGEEEEGQQQQQKTKRQGVRGGEGSPVPGVELFDGDVNVGGQMVAEGLAVAMGYQRGGGGGLRTTRTTTMSQQSSRTMSPVMMMGNGGSGTVVVVEGGGGKGVGVNIASSFNQVAISENSSNENFENASYESSRQQEVRQ